MPRNRPNSRVRDLPDIALLATTGPIYGSELRLALERTFEFRGTHALSTTVPTPPAFWKDPYAAMAAGDELRWKELDAVAQAVSSFLNPVLTSVAAGTWDPTEWLWTEA